MITIVWKCGKIKLKMVKSVILVKVNNSLKRLMYIINIYVIKRYNRKISAKSFKWKQWRCLRKRPLNPKLCSFAIKTLKLQDLLRENYFGSKGSSFLWYDWVPQFRFKRSRPRTPYNRRYSKRYCLYKKHCYESKRIWLKIKFIAFSQWSSTLWNSKGLQRYWKHSNWSFKGWNVLKQGWFLQTEFVCRWYR